MTETKKKREIEKKPSSKKAPKPKEVPVAGSISDSTAPATAENPAATPGTSRVVRSVSDLATNSAQRLPLTKKVQRWKPPRLLDMSSPAQADELANLRNDPKISIETDLNHWAMDPISGNTTMMVYVEYTEETLEQVADTGELTRFEKEIDDLGL